MFDTLFIMISKEMIVKITKKYLKQIIKEAWEDLPGEYRKKYGAMDPEGPWFDTFEEPALTSKEYMDLENVEQELLQHARSLYPSKYSREKRDLLELDLEKEIEILSKAVVEDKNLMDLAKDKLELAVMANLPERDNPAPHGLSGTEYV